MGLNMLFSPGCVTHSDTLTKNATMLLKFRWRCKSVWLPAFAGASQAILHPLPRLHGPAHAAKAPGGTKGRYLAVRRPE